MEARHLSEDRISTLPSILIENILCCVPIRDAVRTSILSRNWRYNWTTIPKLVFNEKHMFDESHEEHLQLEKPRNERKQLAMMCKVVYAIHQVLLLHHGPILEFSLSMKAEYSCVEIDQILLHLSRKNTLKKLQLDFMHSSYKLPLSVMSFHQLTDLSLSRCDFDFVPTFGGFTSLTSLSLYHVDIYLIETFLHLISSSPSLKRLSLASHDFFSFDLHEVFKWLPVIEHLDVNSWTFECFVTGELPIILVRLKSLCMSDMMFYYEFQFLSLYLLIKSSPNLEKIKLRQKDVSVLNTDPERNSLDDYSDIWLEHLNELEIEDFGYILELELEFLKLILAKSPVLKKVTIVLTKWVKTDEEVKILRILLCFPRASPVAKIIVKRW